MTFTFTFCHMNRHTCFLLDSPYDVDPQRTKHPPHEAGTQARDPPKSNWQCPHPHNVPVHAVKAARFHLAGLGVLTALLPVLRPNEPGNAVKALAPLSSASTKATPASPCLLGMVSSHEKEKLDRQCRVEWKRASRASVSEGIHRSFQMAG